MFAKEIDRLIEGLGILVADHNPHMRKLTRMMLTNIGPQIMHIVRSPGVFAKPNLPVVMLTDCALRSQVQQAMRLGVHEFLLKPTSPKALRDRLVSILLRPRPMVQIGKYYVPQPRRPIAQGELRQAA